MSLFKKNILKEYNILNYDGNKLVLHCSKYDNVISPVNGKIKVSGDTATIKVGNKEIEISHINPKIKDGEVHIADIIGAPKFNGSRATIKISIKINDEFINALTYVQRRDKDESSKKKKKKKNKEIIEKLAEIPEEYVVSKEVIEQIISK